MEKKQIILPSKLYSKAPDEELSIRIDLKNTSNTIKENEKNIVLDVAEQNNKERNASIKYKIYGKIKMVFDNFYSGNTDYLPLKDKLFLVGDGSTTDYTGHIPYNEFAFLRNDLLREKNIPSIEETIINFEQNIELTSENTKHTTITDVNAPYQNWNVYLSYVYSGDTSYPMTYTLSGNTDYNFVSGDGIPFILSSNGNYYTLTSPVEHGMNAGEYIILCGQTLNNSVPIKDRIFTIDSVGNEISRSEKFVVNILKNQFKKTGIPNIDTVYICKRCLDIKNITGTTSEYYVHKHKILTDTNDYILDKVGFESSIWRDEKKLIFENYSGENDVIVEKNRMESCIYDFKTPFYLSGLTNNLGYTPTELYTTIIFRNGNGYFNYPLKVGYKFNFHDSWIDKHFDGTKSNETELEFTNFFKNQNSVTYNFKSGSTLEQGSILNGAFVEYNEVEMRERIISESYHKMTISPNIFDHNQDDPTYYSGASLTNLVGLYYQPHYRVKLRQLSPYIEKAKTNDILNLPENTRYIDSEGVWAWRDLYEHGFIDSDGFGTDYPFINGIHYVKLDINFYLRNEKNFINKKDGIKNFLTRIIDC